METKARMFGSVARQAGNAEQGNPSPHLAGEALAKARARLRLGLRAAPAAMLLLTAATLAPGAGATGCTPGHVAVDGGDVRNQTTITASADGGVAVANANGGDGNVALAGVFGDAAAGNGGAANAAANGGMIDLGDINSGFNEGNTIAVGGTGAGCHAGSARVAVDGGEVRNETTIALSADGGLAVANANGGDRNVAVAGVFGDAEAGNGGRADAEAGGGYVSLGDVNAGFNRGNTVAIAGAGGFFGPRSVVHVDGGTIRNTTTLSVSADGGFAAANANGGDRNIAVAGTFGDAAAGNAGTANADASGGTITLGNINSGFNQGNTIAVSGHHGAVAVSGGEVRNETTIDLSADGGVAVANANGGNGNIAVAGTFGDAAAGNGGTANADASGGTITVGDINSGGNSGNQIAVGGGHGPVNVDGGTVTNQTNIDLSADGGTAVANADGGDGNVAAAGTFGEAAAGNGGTANADASGGTITIGDVNSGGNSGNDISIGG